MPGRLDIALLLLGVAMSAACDNRAELTRRNSEALLERLAAAPELSASVEEIRIRPAKAAESIGMISSAAAGRDGRLYLLHRGSDADPVVAMSPDGRVLSSWGRGLFTIPHAVRIGPDGDVWTVDAGASQLRRFASDGLLRTTIEIGSRPWKLNGFRGATDLAFAADGALLAADGYGNARILEYSSDAEPVREWGKPGRGPGQFRLPHAIVLDEDGRIYVADRENGRVQVFNREGDHRASWEGLGKVYSLDIRGGAMWAATRRLDEPDGSPGWLLRLDPGTGRITGHIASEGVHFVAILPGGDLLAGRPPNRLLRLRLDSE